jgi:hypothetical protein
MTLKGKKNHYNVKLLRGYGVSINLKDNKMILTNGQNDITGKSEKEEWFIKNMPYENCSFWENYILPFLLSSALFFSASSRSFSSFTRLTRSTGAFLFIKTAYLTS